ncbi:alpha-2,8-sialyltransferase 8F isoform X2 [Callorhinchus milii]|uniref:alpha-2,8-sialyltransferase 8F isoform X2 n=1 Tax=Callorhinchus milii TaxID=7868 RepID=UPI0004573C95|nr:alpha-2,8-sialyltransferase 8F isoform X2 [Callorhinchus milii]|eukprot:gi/632983948/ref/XP_007908899.1/ PREDICTED: alpha-2,8-sialyltransferase 8F-like isoform X2 [Callorhinchus milii]
MVHQCVVRTVLISCGVCIFLFGILVNFEEPLNYRSQANQNESLDVPTDCSSCESTSQRLKSLFLLEDKRPACEKLYNRIASASNQWRSEEDVLRNIAKIHQCKWGKQKRAVENFRWELRKCCRTLSGSFVTQRNTPVGTELFYEAEPKKKIKITPSIFAIFPKDSPFRGRSIQRCAVVGNAGILHNSSCGAEIDQADFVFRCNLPPMGGNFTKDVGSKTHLVTANPKVIIERYAELHKRRKPFANTLVIYNDALLLFPAFYHSKNTALSFRAHYTLQDFKSKQRVIFFNPIYLKHLAHFWLSKGMQVQNLSTGITVASMAMELCSEVWIYGFWPFGKNTEGELMSHHYFDSLLAEPDLHSTSNEFYQLLRMHSKGIVKLQMGQCEAEETDEFTLKPG